MKAAKETDAKATGTVLRVIRVLRSIAEASGPVTIKDLSSKLDLPASTVHRLLHLLAVEGIIEKDDATRAYQSGAELIRLSSLLVANRTVNEIARPFMQAVVDGCSEACMLVAYLPATLQVSVLAAINSSHPLRYDMQLYDAHTLLWGATGRSVLAFLSEKEQAAVYETGLAAPGSGRKLPSFKVLQQELRAVRDRGYALSYGEKIVGAVGMGSPIYKMDNRVIGSLCITLPQVRFKPANEKRLGGLVRKQAERLSHALGYQGVYPGS
jgi:DNA-binding IclR family transcriptional regulator